jgi:hypothetical protein
LETSLDGVVYCVSRVFERTGVLGGMKMVSPLVALLAEPAAVVLVVAREACATGPLS